MSSGKPESPAEGRIGEKPQQTSRRDRLTLPVCRRQFDSMVLRKIFLPDVPAPAGHYSPAVAANGFLYISGQLPLDPKSPGAGVPDGIDAQTEQVFANLSAVLAAAGSTKEDLVKVTIYVNGIEHWDRINALYTAYMGDHRPARAVVPTPPLHFGALLELEAVALCAE